jgi:uncharacterized membrane protein YdjX (TVP38/TMEM64 family)
VRRVFRSPAARRRTALLLLAAVAGFALLSALVFVRAPYLLDAAWLRGRIAAAGPLAPVAFVLVQTVQVVVAPVPGQALGAVGGYLFGGPAGTVYSVVGVLLGSLVAFELARRFGRPFVERAVDPDALAEFDGFAADHGRAGLFLAFLLPTFPDDLLCFLAGVSEVRRGELLVLVLVGRTPSFVLAAYAGEGAATGRYWEVFALVAALAVVTVLVSRYRTRVRGERG